MRDMGVFPRAVAGALCIVLLSAVGYLGGIVAMGALRPVYSVSVVLGELGQGLIEGSDVKMRGVVVGEVGGITLTDEYRAAALLDLDPGYAIPERSEFRVTGKTLLGEKQVEITFDGDFDEGPFLASGDLIDDAGRVVEFQDVLADLARLFAAIDPDDLATVVNDFFGAFEGMGPDIARSIDAGAEAAGVFSRSLSDQVANTRDLSFVMEELGEVGEDFNRLGRNVLVGMPTLSDNQLRIRALLDELASFSRTMDVTFRVTRPDLDRMMIRGDNVLRMLFDYRFEVGELVQGLTMYTGGFSEGFTAPGVAGQAARFQIILDGGFDFAAELCAGLPPELSDSLPACEPATAADATPAVPTTTEFSFEAPLELVAPQLPQPRAGLEEILIRSLALPSASSPGADR